MPPIPTPEFIALQRAVAGRYSVDREIGRGGMGIVYLAQDVSLERPVAIKLLPPVLAAAPGFRDRFLREARTAAALGHPHIVPIHAVEQVGDLVFFVMEYIPGETVGERVRATGPLPTHEATRVLREVAWALGHAHGRGIIHRDIKPDNILLEAGSGRAVLTDLGIAHAEGAEVSGAAGTPHYVAPELLNGGAPSVASDLYALGVTAWVALTGRRPFEGMEGANLTVHQSGQSAPSLANFAPRATSRLIAAVDRAMERLPERRWPDAESFAAELSATEAVTRAVPTPLRRFITDGRARGEQVVFGLAGAIAAELGLLALYGWDDFAGVVFHTLAALLGAFAVVRFAEIGAQARELRAQGWGQAAAIAADNADPMEEEPPLPVVGTSMRNPWVVLTIGTLKTAAAVVILKLSDDYLVLSLFAAAGMVIMPALTAVQLWRIGGEGKPSLWSRLLNGRAGKWLFGLAGFGLKPRHSAPVPGEPTALALGGSIERLYAALPMEQQHRLAEVPDIAARLQARAMLKGPERTPAVIALETLRLDLLRMQAGTIGEPELTADLEAVKKVGEEVDRVVAAEAEIGKLLGS